MRKQKYIVPAIVCVNAAPQGETCGQPVYFSTPGPGVAGAKMGSVEDFDDDAAAGTAYVHNNKAPEAADRWDN